MSDPPAVPTVEAPEAERRAEAGAVLLDVRQPQEWTAGHVPNSLWIPMGDVAARASELPENRPIVVVCRSGARSARVAQALIDGGYDATNLAGGLQAWAAAGLPLVDDGGEPGTVA